MSEVARLASAKAAAKTLDPISTIKRGPKRSDKFPQTMLPTAMARKPKVMALDMPVIDQPVSREMGRRKTGSENMAPMATQPKTPPAAILLKRAAGVAKGSGTPNKDKVGKVTEKQVLEIAKQKMPDLNAASVEAAVKSVKGTARSMGIEVTA